MAIADRSLQEASRVHLARHPLPDVRDRLQFGDHQGSPLVPPAEQYWPSGCLAKNKPEKSRRMRRDGGKANASQSLALLAAFSRG